MKTNGTILAIALGAALTTTAAPPQAPSASHVVNTNAISSKLESLQPKAKGKTEIYRVGKMSSRPWTEIVGWQPGRSQFYDAENPGPGLTLVSVNFWPDEHRLPATSKQQPPR